MPHAALFDIDGTLVDSVDLHALAWHETFEQFGYHIPLDAIRSQIGKGGDQLLPMFIPAQDVQTRGDQIEHARGELFTSKYLPQVRAFRGVRALFTRIKSLGWRIALASSAKSDEITIYTRLAQIEDLVDAETSADDVEHSKPQPDIFQVALQRVGDLAPSDVVAVGDSPFDAEAAGKIHIATIGLLCGGFPADVLLAAGCVALYKDPADLLAQFEESIFSRLR
jgi:beta-phosphoglucomutase-like phosphatase (HAD superfamily)